MTVASEVYDVEYAGNGVTEAFAIPFNFLSNSDIEVSQRDSTGDSTVLSTGYSITGAGTGSGTCSFTIAPASGYTVRIERKPQILQSMDLVSNDSFPAETVEAAHDRAAYIAQYLRALIARCIQVPAGDGSIGDMELAPVSTRASTILGFDSAGALDYLTSIGTTVLSQAVIGGFLYPRSDSEIAGSSTPTAYYQHFIDVARFGAAGDGSTVDTTAVQAALNAARYGLSRVHFPSRNRNGQTVYIVGKVTVYEGAYVTADPGVIIRSAVTISTDHVFECVSTLGTATALTANATKRDQSVAVTSNSGLSPGQIVCIRDSTYKFTTNGRNLEFNEIDTVVGTTITLKNRLIGSYLTASTAELVPVTLPARDIRFENVYVDVPSSKDGGAFYFSDAYRCQVVNCKSTGQKGQPGVQIWRSAYVTVQGGDFADGQSPSTPGYGYGVNIAQSSHHSVVRGAMFRNVRECAVASNARYCGFIDCVSVSPYDSAFNSHADGSEDCFFVNCRSYYARSKGFVAGFTGSSAADKRIRFVNCESHYSGSYGFWSGADSGRENEDIEFIDCKVFHPSDDTASSYGMLMSRCTRPRIVNPSIDCDGEANARAGIYLEICTDAQVRGGATRSATSGWGLIHSNCTGVLVDGLAISNIGSSQGVHAEGTASTKAIVKNCRVDNDVVFTKNSGDIHEAIEYNTKRQSARGATASVADGGTITHGLVSTPTSVRVQSSVSGEFASVTALSSTTFTVAIKKHDNTAGTTQTIYWEAEV